MWVPLHAGRIDAVLLELAEEGVTEGVGPDGPPRVGQLVPVAGQREPDCGFVAPQRLEWA